jgi:tRNA 5-methylaminomethyl-2-thiouridine biosynthesis bifunctional protein
MPRLPPLPDLDWTTNGAPQATAFEDVYFSKAGGLEEAKAVFLAGTGLPGAWRNRDRFAIGELGFGAGINVLAAWKAWKSTRSPHAQLHISTIEAFPLARRDAARALAAFPELAELAARLLARWPVRVAGPQRLWFPEDGLALTIHVGEAEPILAGMVGQFDAWFLDGFSPARNPAMWTPAVMARIAALSAPGARAATFTVAGDVRRALESAGFAVEKRPGFGAKRERLEARLLGPPASSPAYAQTTRAAREGDGVAGEGAGGPRAPFPYAAAHPKRVAILGAGIAGAACAAALARRGVETIVLEAAPTLGAGASGNPAGLVMPRLDRAGALRELFLAAYLDAIATYEALGALTPCGVEQRAEPKREAALADLIADPPLPEDWFAALPSGAALHPRAGLVRPLAAIKAMLAEARLMLEAPVEALERAGEGWVLRAPDQRAMLKADAVVLACGPALARFAPARFLPLQVAHGQIEWGLGAPPAHALTQGSYVAPFEGGVLFGATFDTTPAEPHHARARNLAALRKLAPEIASGVDAATLQSRASERAATPDRAPIAGLLPDADAWTTRFAGLAHGRRLAPGPPAPAHAGVYVIGGLGARGLTLAPLLGERIAAEMFGEPQALSRAALEAIHPARFLLRALKRR